MCVNNFPSYQTGHSLMQKRDEECKGVREGMLKKHIELDERKKWHAAVTNNGKHVGLVLRIW